jgi:hypothetical protein
MSAVVLMQFNIGGIAVVFVNHVHGHCYHERHHEQCEQRQGFDTV